MDQSTIPQSPVERAGWSVERYADATGVSRAAIYAMPPALQPEFVKVGRRRVIVEPPAAWLRRVGQSRSKEAA